MNVSSLQYYENVGLIAPKYTDPASGYRYYGARHSRYSIAFADGGCGHLTAPQRLGNVLYRLHGYTCQVHLNESFLHAALPAAVTLDDGSLERNAL